MLTCTTNTTFDLHTVAYLNCDFRKRPSVEEQPAEDQPPPYKKDCTLADLFRQEFPLQKCLDSFMFPINQTD